MDSLRLILFVGVLFFGLHVLLRPSPNFNEPRASYREKMEMTPEKLAAAPETAPTPTTHELDINKATSTQRQKAFVFIGVMTGFGSRRRRDSLRNTWMPQGEELQKLEREGIVLRFVIGRSEDPLQNQAIDAEEAQYHDFLRLDHIEGYHRLSAKTKSYFPTALDKWDAKFYAKADDDILLNIREYVTDLRKHENKPRVYIGCMKSGPVLYQKDFKYHESEWWAFGDKGNSYFRHANGPFYTLSRNIVQDISDRQNNLRLFSNEDVTVGAWLIGLDNVEYIDNKRMCCESSDCEWKAAAGYPCIAVSDWKCSGLCNSEEKMKDVHTRCGEGRRAISSTVPS